MSVVPLKKDTIPAQGKFIEIGATGLKNWGGILDDEFLRELRGLSGIKTYREMSRNDAVIGASLFAYITLAKEVSFRVESAEQGNAKADEIAEFIKGALFEDMSTSWRDLLGEIFSFLTYGWSYFEQVYKVRRGPQPNPALTAIEVTNALVPVVNEEPASSKFNDGKIGWRKWAIRGQDTLIRWVLDTHGGIQGMIQRPAPTYFEYFIPINKSLLFRTLIERNNPEGVSILRTAYTSWYYKRRLQVIRGIGIERDLAGLPVLTPPQGLDIWNAQDTNAATLKTQAERVIRNIRRDENEGVVKPFGWELELLSSGGSRQFDITGVISQLNAEMAMSMMTDFLVIGHEKIGARSLATDKRAVFSHAAASFLDSICETITRFAFKELVRLNGWPEELTPKLAHGPVAEIELSELVNFIEKTAGAGLLFPDEELEAHLRQRALLPPPPSNKTFEERREEEKEFKTPPQLLEQPDDENKEDVEGEELK